MTQHPGNGRQAAAIPDGNVALAEAGYLPAIHSIDHVVVTDLPMYPLDPIGNSADLRSGLRPMGAVRRSREPEEVAR